MAGDEVLYLKLPEGKCGVQKVQTAAEDVGLRQGFSIQYCRLVSVVEYMGRRRGLVGRPKPEVACDGEDGVKQMLRPLCCLWSVSVRVHSEVTGNRMSANLLIVWTPRKLAKFSSRFGAFGSHGTYTY